MAPKARTSRTQEPPTMPSLSPDNEVEDEVRVQEAATKEVTIYFLAPSGFDTTATVSFMLVFKVSRTTIIGILPDDRFW